MSRGAWAVVVVLACVALIALCVVAARFVVGRMLAAGPRKPPPGQAQRPNGSGPEHG